MPTQQHMPQLAVALDLPEKQRALALASQLRGTVPWCKVGMELFTHVGPGLLEELSAMGFSVFLDLKFYDIPNTVAQAVKAAAAVGVNMLTLHCQGGERMCRAAAEAAAEAAIGAAANAAAGVSGARPLLFGVTVLTSFAPGEMPGITAQPSDFALDLARMAGPWGLDGVVCSGHEAAAIKASCPGLRCLCPGIRPAGSAAGDQRRVMTPALAVAAGADYLVVGRPITAAADPLATAKQIVAEMASSLI